MAYRITYGGKYELIRPSSRVRRKEKCYTAILIMCIALSLLLSGLLVKPNDRKIAMDAVEDLLGDVSEGESLTEAITVFCRNIVESAERIE